jgi:hypothetical protein
MLRALFVILVVLSLPAVVAAKPLDNLSPERRRLLSILRLGTEITLTKGTDSIKIWRFGRPDPAGRALVVLTGDRPEPESQELGKREDLIVSQGFELLRWMSIKTGMPIYYVSRPGYLGSTGKRRDKFLESNVNLIAWAIDKLITRENVKHFAVIGQSGGTVGGMGHIRRALFPAKCYVMIAGIYSFDYHWMAPRHMLPMIRMADPLPEMRRLKGIDDILPRVGEIPANLKSRFMFIADPRDTVVGYYQSAMIHEALGRAGFETTLRSVKTRGETHHAQLSEPAIKDAAKCLRSATEQAGR